MSMVAGYRNFTRDTIIHYFKLLMKKDIKPLGIMSIPFYVHSQYHSNKVFTAVELKLQGQVQG